MEDIRFLWNASDESVRALFLDLIPVLGFEEISFVVADIVQLQPSLVCEGHLSLLSTAIDVCGDSGSISFLWALTQNGGAAMSVRMRAAEMLYSLLKMKNVANGPNRTE